MITSFLISVIITPIDIIAYRMNALTFQNNIPKNINKLKFVIDEYK